LININLNHLNLKLENILESNDNLIIGDFGLNFLNEINYYKFIFSINNFMSPE
jgi:hypothetical protein